VAPGLPFAAAQLSEGGFEDEQQADSLYRRAREALGAGDYKRAASLFQRVASMSKDNARASDALYYQAFALYRAGETSDLRTALESLTRLEDKYPRASTRSDARTLRVRVCGELAKRGDEACASEVTERASASSSSSAGVSSSQGRGCPSENDENDERIAALNALLQMDAERAIPILERVMARRDECSAGLRRKAVFLISQKNDERSADMLLNAARNDPDKEVRGQALFWLGQTRDERAVPMLLDILNNSSDRELQEKAIFGLAQHRSDRARQALRDVAARENAPSNVRQQAIFWLGQGRGAENGEFLRSLFSKTSDKEIKDKIIFSLSQIRDPNSAKWLLEIATGNDESLETRKQALFWAGQSKNLDIGDLDALYAKMKDREMKEQVIFVLSQRRGDDAVDKLISIAKNEPDRELRKKAIFWLSQSKDPRVAKFLEDLISK
jgi:HEAT repeat protein